MQSLRRAFEEALSIYQKSLPKNHPDISRSLNNLGTSLSDLGEYGAARKAFQQLAIGRRSLPRNHPATANCLNNLGVTLRHLGDVTAAREAYVEAVQIYRHELDGLALAQTESQQSHQPSRNPQFALSNLLSIRDKSGDVYTAVLDWKGSVTVRQQLAAATRDLADEVVREKVNELRQVNSQILALSLPQVAGERSGAADPIAAALKLSTRRTNWSGS